MNIFPGNNFMFGLQQQQQQQIAISALSAVLRQDYPNLTEQQLATMAPVLLQRMYQNGDPVVRYNFRRTQYNSRY